MLKETRLDTFDTALHNLNTPVLRKVYFFHDIRILCQTNHPTILALLDTMLGSFPEPAFIAGKATYTILCFDNASQFPVPLPLPRQRKRTDTIRLLTGTRLKYYRGRDTTILYQSYTPLPPVNETALSVIDPVHGSVLTQLEMPEHYQPTFLRRYLLLLALGQLMNSYGFEACHAAAVTAPNNTQLGALLLGSSGSGKTTLSLGCATQGCGLLGDDLVLLRANDSHVADAPATPISAYSITHEVAVRSGTLALWPTLDFLKNMPADQRDKRYCHIEHIQAGTARTQTSIRLLLFPLLTDAPSSTCTPLSKASTLQRLVDECLGKKTLPSQAQERLFLFLSKLVEQADGYQLSIARGSHDGPQLVHALLLGDAV